MKLVRKMSNFKVFMTTDLSNPEQETYQLPTRNLPFVFL
jgi:hypothetical protein